MPDKSTKVTTTGAGSVEVNDPSSDVYIDVSSVTGCVGVKVTNVSSDLTKLLCYAWHTSGSGFTTTDESVAWGEVSAGEMEFATRPGDAYTHLVLWYETISSDQAVTCLFVG